MLEKKEVLDILEALRGEHSSAKSVGLSHADIPVLYLPEPSNALFLVGAANVYVTNTTKTATFHGPSFYTAARTVLVERYEFYHDYAAQISPTSMSVMTVTLQGLTRSSQAVNHLFLRNMRLFDNDPQDRKKHWANSAR